MAGKRKKSRKSSKSKAKSMAGRTALSVAPRYGGSTYSCYGKKVKNARGGGKHPRVFCGKKA